MNLRLPNPSHPEYRNNYDRIFGKPNPCSDGKHEFPDIRPAVLFGGTYEPRCKICGYSPLDEKPR